MNLEVSKKRRDADNDNNQDRLKIPKLIPIKNILSSGNYVSNCVKNKKSLPVLDNNNNNKPSNNNQSYSSYVKSPPNLIDVSDRAHASSSLVDNATNFSLSIDTNPETNSKKTQTKFVRPTFLLIAVIDQNKILRVHCQETTSSKISENKCNCNNKLIQSNTNNNSKLISPIRLTKSKDGSWHSTEVTKNSVQDIAIQTEISFSLERTMLTVSSYEAELEFVKNLLQNQETVSKKPLITQLNDLKLHLVNYPIRDPILIPKNQFKKLLENPYLSFLQLMLNKPQYYFEKYKTGLPDNFYDIQFNGNENNSDCYLITLKSLEEILKIYEDSLKNIKDDVLIKSSQKDVDEIDTERTALFNQLTLMKYLPSKSLNNNNCNNFNNFNNVPDQLLKKLFFNGTTISSANNSSHNRSNVSQNNRVPKFFSNSNAKNGTRKLSRILDLSKQTNSGPAMRPPFDDIRKNENTLDARCAEFYDFHL